MWKLSQGRNDVLERTHRALSSLRLRQRLDNQDLKKYMEEIKEVEAQLTHDRVRMIRAVSEATSVEDLDDRLGGNPPRTRRTSRPRGSSVSI